MPNSRIKDTLLEHVNHSSSNASKKITIVGAGHVGMSSAASILLQGITKEICLIDSQADRVLGEMMDLQHGSMFFRNINVTSSTDFAISRGSRLCIITSGVRLKPGENRFDLLKRNAEIMKGVIPKLVKHSPDSILLIVSNPVDVMTYFAWKLSKFPKYRVIGSGTSLDSSRFNFLLSKELGISPASCGGWIIGEHGDSSVAVWSGVTVGGVRLKQLHGNIGTDKDDITFGQIHKQVVESAYNVTKLKGYTSWAIGMAVASIAQSIMQNIGNVVAVSVSAKGHYGITEDVWLSLPVVLDAGGVTDVIKQPLNESEQAALRKSAAQIAEAQATLEI